MPKAGYLIDKNGREYPAKVARGATEAFRFGMVGWTVDSNDCWNWNGFRNPKGYGKFRYVGGQMAHRFSLEQKLGRRILAGKEVLHSCDNRSCVNPDHLNEGTHAENMREASVRTGFPQARLNADQVKKIRADIEKMTVADLARTYGVSRAAIRAVRDRRNWKWVPEEKEDK